MMQKVDYFNGYVMIWVIRSFEDRKTLPGHQKTFGSTQSELIFCVFDWNYWYSIFE